MIYDNNLLDLKNYENKHYFSFWKSFVFDISKWQNRLFTLLGLVLSVFFLFKGFKKEKVYFFVAFFVTYIIILSGISCGQGDRFHLVTFPFVILLMAKFLSEKKRLKPFFEPLQK